MALTQKTNKVSFGRGLKASYTALGDSIKSNLIYFATDEQNIYVNGISYGLSVADAEKLNNSVNSVTLDGNTVKVTYTGGKAATSFNLTASNVKMADSKTVEEVVTANATAITAEADRAQKAEKANADAITQEVKDRKAAIEALDLTEVGGTGKVITTVSQLDGQVSAAAIDLTAGNVAATPSEADDTHVAVAGATVAAQISDLAKSIKTTVADAKSYSVKKLTDEEVTALGDANVKEAYKLIDEDKAQAGDTIKIYKDSSLKSVALDGQILNFTYILADGSESTVGVDVSTFLAESEFGNGLEVVNHIVNVKVDAASESFLTVGANGVKLAGVQSAIDSAAAKATTVVEEKAEGHVTVAKSTGADGHAIYTVSEDDIASDAALTAEVARAKAAEDTIEASVGLADDGSHVTTTGNYTKEATTIAGEIAALDAQVKVNSDAIDTLNGEGAGSVKKAVADAKAELLGDAAEGYNTLGKLEDKIIELDNKAASAHTVVNAKADGHVKVSVAKSEDGSHDVVTVSENDIASKDALDKEIAARKAVIGQEGQTYTANNSANYIDDATSLNDADVKLDAAIKGVENMFLWYEEA